MRLAIALRARVSMILNVICVNQTRGNVRLPSIVPSTRSASSARPQSLRPASTSRPVLRLESPTCPLPTSPVRRVASGSVVSRAAGRRLVGTAL